MNDPRGGGQAQGGLARKGALAYVALGANLGDRLATLREAVRRIDASHGLDVVVVSSIWETAAVGPPQPDYLNAVIAVDACKTPWAHLKRLHEIERELGRVRREGERWGPRTLDLDLLWQGGLRLSGGPLQLPHPRLTERAFVLAPLAEIASALPIGAFTVCDWLAARPEVERASVVRVGEL